MLSYKLREEILGMFHNVVPDLKHCGELQYTVRIHYIKIDLFVPVSDPVGW